MTPFPEEIAANKTFLEAYVNAIVSNIRLAVLDRKCKIVWVNDRFCDLTQYSEQELIGRSIEELNLVCHDASFFKIVFDTISSGAQWSGEIKTQSKDGSFCWVKTNILPIKNRKEEIESYLILNSNITATKAALEEKELALEKLLQSEARYRALVTNQPDLISLCDATGTRIYVNASYCNFFDKDFNELIGTNIQELPFPGLSKEILSDVFQLTPQAPEISAIHLIQNHKGDQFWISLRIKGVFNAQGNLFEILTIGRDVTNLKNAELQKSNYIQDLERIAFMTSHNVRGPIATILGLIEVLRMNGIEADKWNMVLDSFKKCIGDLDVYTREMGAFIYQRQSS